MPGTIFFRSGLSRSKDFAAAVRASLPAGISMDQCSDAFLSEVCAYIEFGGLVFADTGAFGAYRRGSPMGHAEFSQFLDGFGRLMPASGLGSLWVVAPDVVGDQGASLVLLREFRPRLELLHRRGANIIVPLQRGGLALSQLYRAIVELLRFPFTSGLPSNAAALSADEVLEFLGACQPPAVHFLGAARSRRFRALLGDARHSLPNCAFSYDAAVIRQIAGTLGMPADGCADFAKDELASGIVDEGGIAEGIRSGNAGFLEETCRVMALDMEEVRTEAAKRDGDYLAAVEYLCPYFDSYWPALAVAIAASVARSEWRTISLSRNPVFLDTPHAIPETALLF